MELSQSLIDFFVLLFLCASAFGLYFQSRYTRLKNVLFTGDDEYAVIYMRGGKYYVKVSEHEHDQIESVYSEETEEAIWKFAKSPSKFDEKWFVRIAFTEKESGCKSGKRHFRA